MESGSIYTVLSIFLVLSGIATAFTASSKGRDAMGWFIVGFLFAPIALPIALVASPIRENMSSFKACSSCMEQIHINATRCPFCTSAVKERETKSEITTETVTVNRDQICKDKQRLFDTAESLGFKVDSHPGLSRFTFIKDGKSFDFFDVDKAKDFLVASKK
ncbi:hypothetical protein DFP83_1322 [Idiomarina fontislapidosi]|nr:hypothetical protein [Idiomarina fontislapidosi]PYE30036.1 hypothetical protein DFP83_1322 [Idiomarina fontislapidosi]